MQLERVENNAHHAFNAIALTICHEVFMKCGGKAERRHRLSVVLEIPRPLDIDKEEAAWAQKQHRSMIAALAPKRCRRSALPPHSMVRPQLRGSLKALILFLESTLHSKSTA